MMVVVSDGSTRPLPRGPHGLTREEVEASQRDRLLHAMTEAAAEKGYANVAVADVLARAGVSRATFYALFTDKDHCFRECFGWVTEQIVAMLGATLTGAGDGDGDGPGISSDNPIDVLAVVIDGYLGLLHGAPAMARTFLVEVYAAGPEAIEQRRASLDGFIDLVAGIFDGHSEVFGTRPEQRFAVEMLVGGVSSLVTNLVGTGRVDELPALREPLLALAEQLSGLRRTAAVGRAPSAGS